MFLLIKVLFLVAALKLHDVKLDPISPTLLYTIPLALLGLAFGSSFLAALVGTVITLCVAFVYFALLTRFNSGVEYFGIMGAGAFLLVVFI